VGFLVSSVVSVEGENLTNAKKKTNNGHKVPRKKREAKKESRSFPKHFGVLQKKGGMGRKAVGEDQSR